MRRASRARLIAAVTAAVWMAALATACGPAAPAGAAARSTGLRAAGRAYDGAPPTIPHEAAIGACTTCHDADGAAIDGVGVAPASPHGDTGAEGSFRRCRQCHVPQAAGTSFVASRFVGLAQGPWKGSRATPGAPPRIPHPLQMRGECLTCHAGPGARVEIRTTHPERTRCRQCHVPEVAPNP
ncbi:MAG: nitrate reductase cytochrome c-type subunit [Acidobacteria bacterium]|nr:nitrate reductase cytochrome c-type subunit [Acidobacteriota bacterium]